MVNPKIVVSLLTKDQEFQVMQASDAETAAARAGFDAQVVYARNNSTLQAEQLYRSIQAHEAARPFAIVVQTVTGEGLERVARDAAKAGIGWVLLNRDVPYIDALRREYPKLPVAIVTVDQLAIGRIQGQQIRRLLPKGGNVLYVQGPADTSAAQRRLEGMQDAIAGANVSVKVIAGEWTEESGEKAVQSWLRLSSSQEFRADLVAAQNDAMAVGARKAIASRKPEWSKVPFAGCDGLPEGGQRLVREKVLAATVIVPSSAGPAVELIDAWKRTGKQQPARVTLMPKGHP